MIILCRKARKVSHTNIYHVVMRGVNRQNIFEETEDKEIFYNLLMKLKEKINFEIFGYCFMDNHVHLLIKEGEQTLSKTMQRLNTSYAMRFNHKYDRCGHLFQGRFISEPVETDEYFLTALKYIHQNPVKADICSKITEYFWSSIHNYCGQYGIVSTDHAISMFSNSCTEFLKFMNIYENIECLDIAPPRRLSEKKALEAIKETSGLLSPFDIQTLPTENRNKILKTLFYINGISGRQISRITGISLRIVLREKPA